MDLTLQDALPPMKKKGPKLIPAKSSLDIAKTTHLGDHYEKVIFPKFVSLNAPIKYRALLSHACMGQQTGMNMPVLCAIIISAALLLLSHYMQSGQHPLQSGHHPLQPGHHPLQSGHHPLQSGQSQATIKYIQSGHHPLQSGQHPIQSGQHPLQSGQHLAKNSIPHGPLRKLSLRYIYPFV